MPGTPAPWAGQVPECMPLWSQCFAFVGNCFINIRENLRWVELNRNQESSRYSIHPPKIYVCPLLGPTLPEGKRGEEAPAWPQGAHRWCRTQGEQRGSEGKEARGSGKTSGGGELSQGFKKWATHEQGVTREGLFQEKSSG